MREPAASTDNRFAVAARVCEAARTYAIKPGAPPRRCHTPLAPVSEGSFPIARSPRSVTVVRGHPLLLPISRGLRVEEPGQRSCLGPDESTRATAPAALQSDPSAGVFTGVSSQRPRPRGCNSFCLPRSLGRSMLGAGFETECGTSSPGRIQAARGPGCGLRDTNGCVLTDDRNRPLTRRNSHIT